MKAKCSEIKIGNRVRKDLGNIEDLADNIKELGLLQPIGVTKDNELVFGERRLAACKSLNYEEIEVVVIDSDNLLECETTENVNRKNFNMSERVEIRKIFKKKEIEKRGKMMSEGTQIGNLPIQWTKNELAKITGISLRTADKEDSIVAFENQDIINQVDNNELSVSKAYCLVKKLKKEAEELKPNDTDTLPVEENVEVEAESVEINTNTYTITITDNYGSLELPKDLSNAIRYFSEEVKGLPKEIIEATLNRDFKSYM